MVVWGEDYIREFLALSFPTLMARGNLDGFPFLGGARFILMTTIKDWQYLQKTPQVRKLQQMMEVHPIFIDAMIPNPARPSYNHKYIRVSLAQSDCISRVGVSADCIFFLYPDFVYSAGALSRIATRMDEGYEAVCCPMPFLSQEAATNGLYDKEHLVVDTAQGPVVTIQPRKLVEMCIKHPHPVMKGFDTTGAQLSEWPGFFIWPVPGEGWLFHSFHLHPIALRPKSNDPNYFQQFELSLDDEFVSKVFEVGSNIYFPKDSDEFALCSFRSEMSPPHPRPGRRGALLPAIRWAEKYASLTHRWFLTAPFRWHHSSTTEKAWLETEARASDHVRAIRDRLNVPDMVLSYEDPSTYTARQRRKLHYAQIDT